MISVRSITYLKNLKRYLKRKRELYNRTFITEPLLNKMLSLKIANKNRLLSINHSERTLFEKRNSSFLGQFTQHV